MRFACECHAHVCAWGDVQSVRDACCPPPALSVSRARLCTRTHTNTHGRVKHACAHANTAGAARRCEEQSKMHAQLLSGDCARVLNPTLSPSPRRRPSLATQFNVRPAVAQGVSRDIGHGLAHECRRTRVQQQPLVCVGGDCARVLNPTLSPSPRRRPSLATQFNVRPAVAQGVSRDIGHGLAHECRRTRVQQQPLVCVGGGLRQTSTQAAHAHLVACAGRERQSASCTKCLVGRRSGKLPVHAAEASLLNAVR